MVEYVTFINSLKKRSRGQKVYGRREVEAAAVLVIELHSPPLPEAELPGRKFNQSESAACQLIRNKQNLKCLTLHVFTEISEVCRSKELLRLDYRQHQVSSSAADCVECLIKCESRERSISLVYL